MLLPIIFMLLLGGGAVLAAQSSINGRLGAITGVIESAWLTFIMGAVLTFLLMFFLSRRMRRRSSACPSGSSRGRCSAWYICWRLCLRYRGWVPQRRRSR